MFHWQQVYIWVLLVVWYLILSYLPCLISSGLALSYPLSLPFLASILDIHSWLLSAVGIWWRICLCIHIAWVVGPHSLDCLWAAVFFLCASLNRYFVAIWGSHTIRECWCELLWLEKSVQEGHCLFACGARSKKLIQNVSPRSVVKCYSFRLKGQENTPQIIRTSPLVGWPYCAEVTPHIGQALRPKTLSTLPRWCLTADRP